jgi:hypothetical protein
MRRPRVTAKTTKPTLSSATPSPIPCVGCRPFRVVPPAYSWHDTRHRQRQCLSLRRRSAPCSRGRGLGRRSPGAAVPYEGKCRPGIRPAGTDIARSSCLREDLSGPARSPHPRHQSSRWATAPLCGCSPADSWLRYDALALAAIALVANGRTFVIVPTTGAAARGCRGRAARPPPRRRSARRRPVRRARSGPPRRGPTGCAARPPRAAAPARP